jgi:methyl acetate hydrolase
VSKLTWEERFFDLPLIFEPGTSWAYSPSTDYAGRLVEILSGVSLEDYFQTHILGPLKMTSTSFILRPDLKARATFPIGFRDLADNNKLLPTLPAGSPWAFFDSMPDTPSIFFGAWGLWSCFDDYSLLLVHLLHLATGVEPTVKPILGETAWKSLFEGNLTAEAKAALELTRVPKVPVAGCNWGSALFINEVDWEGRRRAGSAACTSACHFLWPHHAC